MRIGNVWRSFGHHKKIRAAIEEMYDSPTAKLHATTCIAKVVRTRWATFEGPERTLLRCTFGVAPPFAENSDSVPPMRRALADCRRVARRPSEGMRSPIQDVQPFAVVFGNVTDFIRRFRSWGLGCEREFPWALLELVGSPLAEESESRAGIARGLAISLHSGTLPADGFSDKFVGWFRTDLAAGNIPAAAYDLLDFIATKVDGDVQGIESFNSVLRVMTQRAPCIIRDLVSSRHVIRNSDAHLVSEASYTESLRREAHAVANVGTEHERLQPPPILDASLPPVRVCVRWRPCKRNTIVRLAQDVKAFVRL